MAQVIVRNLDSNVVAALKRNATRHSRSLERELRAILTEAARLAPGDRVALSRAIRAMTPRKRLLSNSARLIRRDRDRR